MPNYQSGINFGFENEEFYVEYACSRKVGNLREEFDKRAVELYSYNPKIILGLSTGLDSQAVLHSFYKQGIPISTAFMYLKTCNENELERLEILEKKYDVKTTIIEIDPYEKKEEALEFHKTTGLPPYQFFHLEFVNHLPEDYIFIQGMSGPDVVYKKNGWHLFESANSIELSRLRALLLSKRPENIIGWERTGEILLSLINDEVFHSFMFAFPYISQSGFKNDQGKNLELNEYWDVYIKPSLYGKYWKDELIYFPKYQGLETIDWITSKKWHNYKENLIYIPYGELIKHLSSFNGNLIRFYQRPNM